MNANTKYQMLRVIYFPLQLIIGLLICPILIIVFAAVRADCEAFDDTYITKDNPILNQDGPSMTRKKSTPWVLRFIGFDFSKRLQKQ